MAHGLPGPKVWVCFSLSVDSGLVHRKPQPRKHHHSFSSSSSKRVNRIYLQSACEHIKA